MEEKLKQESSDIIKIVMFGPESTGKTTLAKALAAYYNTEWVPEFARQYLQEKWNREQKICEPKDLIPIAEGQITIENKLTKKANKILFCDTDLLETKVYSEVYYLGNCNSLIEKYAVENIYNLYFLMYIDVPWEKDDLRDKPGNREEMFTYFKNTLDTHNKNYVLLKGDIESRIKAAIGYIEKLIEKNDNTH